MTNKLKWNIIYWVIMIPSCFVIERNDLFLLCFSVTLIGTAGCEILENIYDELKRKE